MSKTRGPKEPKQLAKGREPITLEQYHARARKLWGPDMMKWRFVCPACGWVASIQDWKDAGAPVEAAAFSCVGRWAKAGQPVRDAFGNGPKPDNAPCNYAGGGLLRLNPVTFTEGHEAGAFDVAPRPDGLEKWPGEETDDGTD